MIEVSCYQDSREWISFQEIVYNIGDPLQLLQAVPPRLRLNVAAKDVQRDALERQRAPAHVRAKCFYELLMGVRADYSTATISLLVCLVHGEP